MKNPNWSVEDARKLYNVQRWSEGYFDINQDGKVQVHLSKNKPILLESILTKAKAQGLSLPLLVRFPNILHHRIEALKAAFEQAMQTHQVSANFYPIYPIKVNQQKRVIEEVLKVQGVGLESGSKAELMGILSLYDEKPGRIVCNGYKDSSYIRLSMVAKALGHDVHIIIEKPSDVKHIISEAKLTKQRPTLGLRLRLSTISQGKWQNTGGEKSKFGLDATQCLEVINLLKKEGYLDCLTLIHTHLGSQIANLSDIKKGLNEVSSWYSAFIKMGVHIKTIDVGGGLGVDYEGTHSKSDCSMNYTVAEYAQTVVGMIAQQAKTLKVPMPNLMTESGRAMTAHHAILLTNIIDKQNPDDSIEQTNKDDTNILDWFASAKAKLNQHNAQEIYEQSQSTLEEVLEMFLSGQASLSTKALAESYHTQLCLAVHQYLNPQKRAQRVLWDTLNEKLSVKYICNFSIFQSLPDIWAIDQIFPMMPISGLLQKPSERGLIRDITCDSDGRVDHYVDGAGVESTLPLPPLEKGDVIATFMVGAYQEILGDMHNLFGDTDSVHVIETKDGFALAESQLGDSVEAVLKTVHFEPRKMLRHYKHQIQKANLDEQTKQFFHATLAASLTSSTYLDSLKDE